MSEVVKIISNDRFPCPRKKYLACIGHLNSRDAASDVSKAYSCTAKS